MKALVFALTALFSVSALANTQINSDDLAKKFYTFGKSDLKEVPVDQKTLNNYIAGNRHMACQDGEESMVFDKSNTVLGPLKKEVDEAVEIVDGANQVVDGIINIGKKIWDIIEKGKPVANLNFQESANALPRGVKCWDELSNWEVPSVRSYVQTYKNLYGMEVVRFEFDVIYTHSGQFNDKGQYLTNVQVHPKNVFLAWGFDLDAVVKIPSLVNLGSSDDPVAGMQVDVEWRTSSPLTENNQGVSIFVQGDGGAKIL